MCFGAHVEHSHDSGASPRLVLSEGDVVERCNLAETLFPMRSIGLHTSVHNTKAKDYAAAVGFIGHQLFDEGQIVFPGKV